MGSSSRALRSYISAIKAFGLRNPKEAEAMNTTNRRELVVAGSFIGIVGLEG